MSRKEEHLKQMALSLSKSTPTGPMDTGQFVIKREPQDVLNKPYLQLNSPILTVTEPAKSTIAKMAGLGSTRPQMPNLGSMKRQDFTSTQRDPSTFENTGQVSKPFIMPFVGTPKKTDDFIPKAFTIPLPGEAKPSIFNRRSEFISPEIQEYIDDHKAEYTPTSPLYKTIVQNWDRWVMLADPNRKLTNEEKKEALNASQTIRDYIAELEKDPTVGIIRDDPLNLRDFGALSRLLSLKGDKFTAFVSGAVDALPVTDNTVNAPIMSVVHDPQLQSYLFKQQTPFEISRNSNPGWYTAGSVFSTTAFMVTGSEALGAMGIASGVLKNAILMGGFNAANSIADGEPADKVIFDTLSGSLGGALGGTFGEAIGGSFTKALIDKGLSDQSIKLIASVPSGLSFGTMTTAVEESKNALYYGKDYKPDLNNILLNIGFATLFGTLEAFKSVPGAAKIQSDYILGKPSAEQRAVDFINEQAQKLQTQPASPRTNPDMLPEMPQSGDTVAEQYINQWPGTGKGSNSGVESPNAKGYTGKWDSFFEEPTNGQSIIKQQEDQIVKDWYHPQEPDILGGTLKAEGLGDTGTQTIKWGIQDIEVRPAGEGFFGQRIQQINPRVDAYELKINPNNESYYLKSPSGGYVQYENMVNDVVMDGKLVIQQKSFYHINDLPDFARNMVLQEATRQVEAAANVGYTVEWLVSDPKAVAQLTEFFRSKKISIIVKYFPE